MSRTRKGIVAAIRVVKTEMDEAQKLFSAYYAEAKKDGIPESEIDLEYAEFSYGQGILERELENLEADLYILDYRGCPTCGWSDGSCTC